MSALSETVCSVPTASSLADVSIYDPLCSGGLDGLKWAGLNALSGAYIPLPFRSAVTGPGANAIDARREADRSQR